MAKKNKNKQFPQQTIKAAEISARPALISKRGWRVIGGGIVLLIIGYFVLSLADPMGQNWAANLSPFLILGGYATIGIGIITKDPIPKLL